MTNQTLSPIDVALTAAERAERLVNALHRLTLSNSLIDTDVLNKSTPTSDTQLLRAYDLLYMHNTASGLLRILSDEIAALIDAVNALDDAATPGTVSPHTPKNYADACIS